MGYQEDRTRRIEIFEDTLQYCERDAFLMKAIAQTREGTILYQEPTEECGGRKEKRYSQPCAVDVSSGRILEAARKLCLEYPDNRIGVLNSASAVNPGGEVIRGGTMQEESLCRCSTLYPCLNTDALLQQYYGYNRQQDSKLYTDVCIFTPGIVGIQSDTRWGARMKESEWFFVDVISCSPPDLRGECSGERDLSMEESSLLSDQELMDLLRKRITGIFYVAAENHIDILVAGAFGCGTFCNSPYMVAQAFKEALEEFRYFFKAVEFAVPSPSLDRNYYDIFSSTLRG